jgi:hypothetical protein
MVSLLDSKKSNRDLVRRQKNQKLHSRYRSGFAFSHIQQNKIEIKEYSPGIYRTNEQFLWAATN